MEPFLDARSPTPPVPEEPAPPRRVAVLDVDGTLTPHAGHLPDSLTSRWVAALRRDPLAKARPVAAAYVDTHVDEAARTRLMERVLRLREVEGYHLILATYSSPPIVEAYLTRLGLLPLIDLARSHFIDNPNMRKAQVLAAQPWLTACEALFLVDDDPEEVDAYLKHLVGRVKVAAVVGPLRPWIGHADGTLL